MDDFTETAERNSEVVILPCKAHFFHEACIALWMAKQNVCPVCRYEVTLTGLKTQKKELEKLLKTINKEASTPKSKLLESNDLKQNLL